MTSRPATIRVASLYQFTSFPDPAAIRGPLLAACEAVGLKGTLLLAQEGINGTIAGSPEGVERVLESIRALPGCAGLDVKSDFVDALPFRRMKVRLKAEIVTLGVDHIDAASDTATYVEPQDWNALIADPDTLVIDTRNSYESAIGTFHGAIAAETESFRAFPAWFRDKRSALLQGKTKVAMFCTGGIRCEKATAFLKAEGVQQVYHLKGGILRYLEEVSDENSLWQGECFVFDQRVAVGHGLAPGSHALCHACRRPIGAADRASPLFVPGVQCPACSGEREESQKRRYAERQRQVDLADARGLDHLAPQPTQSNQAPDRD